MARQNTHVLLVHGVGVHTKLSSLIRTYLTLRSEIKKDEVSGALQDRIIGWRVKLFDESASPPLILLTRNNYKYGRPNRVFIHEVNYSQIAGTIRENHPINLTQLFVDFDLAVQVSATALEKKPPDRNSGEGSRFDDVRMAQQVRELASIFLAVTVPILGIFPFLSKFLPLKTFVSDFSRFFEDVVTFAMDKSGYRLITAHLDKTVHSIRRSGYYGKGDRFILVGHSLGSVVAHNFLVRQWETGGASIPDKVLTFGSPIGLLCWLWRLLQGSKMDLASTSSGASKLFIWDHDFEPFRGNIPPIHWLNVVNQLDPLATAFPDSDVFMKCPTTTIAGFLHGGGVQHRFIRTGGPASAASAHTDYMTDRPKVPFPEANREQTFLDYLLGFIGLWEGSVVADRTGTQDTPSPDWRTAIRDLWRLKMMLWGIAAICLLLFFSLVRNAFGLPVFSRDIFWIPAVLYLWPPLMIGLLASSQRSLWGRVTQHMRKGDLGVLPRYSAYRIREILVPNKRYHWLLSFIPLAVFGGLIVSVIHFALPHSPHSNLMALSENALLLGILFAFFKRPEATAKTVASILPVVFAMSLPCAIFKISHGESRYVFISSVTDITLGGALFISYLLTLSITAIVDRWENIVRTAITPAPR